MLTKEFKNTLFNRDWVNPNHKPNHDPIHMLYNNAYYCINK